MTGAFLVLGVPVPVPASVGTLVLAVLPAGATVLTLFAGPARVRRWARRAAGRLAGLSGATLLSALLTLDGTYDESRALFAGACLLVPVQAAAYRWAPRVEALAGGAVAAASTALWTVALLPDASFFEAAGMAAFWCLPSAGAAAVGGYPRLTERRRAHAVREAERAEQLRLAHDLHDFVAHDISGIVAQAQAARFVADRNPAAVVAALERIERVGLAALTSLDRTVGALREPLPGTTEVVELISRFETEGGVRARIGIGEGVEGALSREAAAIVHRVVTEALTNVRRHATGATRVDVRLAFDGRAVRLTVADDGASASPPTPRERGGTGLVALSERVRAAGGDLRTTAGPDGWTLTATLPTPPVSPPPAGPGEPTLERTT
ncbi:two-component sensor histidine kinase [Streptomyces sp. BR123]|uniref:sensor histidine kinase n=1 Tax=Streptomyces sp. BR123 TaxID=2749828 RepID=UPI0015C44A33|nr:histidine kinase [Streptomyces sp. BR123]NXY99094.1 two-component sensor histidine kinase [Streptomyces sp. BR123]